MNDWRPKMQTDEDKITSIKAKIEELKERAEKMYEVLKDGPNADMTLYFFNRKCDELYDVINSIMYYKNKLDGITMLTPRTYPDPESDNYYEIDYQEIKRNHLELLEIHKLSYARYQKAIADLNSNPHMYRRAGNLEMELINEQHKVESYTNIVLSYTKGPDLTDGDIDIYIEKREGSQFFRGRIKQHGSPYEIGSIEYRGETHSTVIGDIGYNIDAKFRGNNYAYKALKLIAPLIATTGIEDVLICAHKDNLPSCKTIEKFGGKPSEGKSPDIICYKCHLPEILKSQEEIVAIKY